jgi:hypothetical protein
MPRKRADTAVVPVLRESRAIQERDPKTGRFMPIDLDSEAVERMKTRLRALIYDGVPVREALKEVGMSVGLLYHCAQRDEELADCLKTAEGIRSMVIAQRMDDIIDNPERYDQALTRPSYFNFIAFRQKKLDPSYRDNSIINVGLGITLQDLVQVQKAYWQVAGQEPHEGDVVEGELA